MAGIFESVRSGGVRPDIDFPKVLDGCHSYLPWRCKTGHNKKVAIPKISCERHTLTLGTDSMIPAINCNNACLGERNGANGRTYIQSYIAYQIMRVCELSSENFRLGCGLCILNESA